MYAIFTSEKLEKSDKLVDAVNKMTINDVGYELNTATTSDAQIDLARDPDTVPHSSNGTMDQKLLSSRTIGEVSDLFPPSNPRISAIKLASQTLLMPAAQEIFPDTAFGNTCKNRTPRRISRIGVEGSITIFTSIHSVI